ncbi:hypothetical protein KOR34_26060 [Posidoniimonas corsicana]|uniref:DUF6602 domain-containing protein n=1 Tax=Posidoniimonas corsicana TaxID=1938618 RepID=A0A5C5VG45_9BACT|nr:DUF6602 domain-containing protein [Posidoniimonas corsicana]TWT37648.1 hypothetical protein KOR34_26060 [Posidoniimonas corsicana]
MDKNKHDLYDFMQQMTVLMSAEYDRISRRATEDPGTAGDQGEENWATLLRGWLPRNYEVVTKGRIISEKGETSPQIDVLVLNSVYPEKLLDKKLYLAAGVAAAFECKTTLKGAHIEEAVATCKAVKNLFPKREGTPYEELYAPVVYGILAHSHVWKREKSTPEENVTVKLETESGRVAEHPRELLDVLCVADLGAWTQDSLAFFGPRVLAEWPTHVLGDWGANEGQVNTSFIAHAYSSHSQSDEFTPIGALIAKLTLQLAREEPSLRSLARYYRVANLYGSGRGIIRHWDPTAVYSETVQQGIASGKLTSNKPWDSWSLYCF